MAKRKWSTALFKKKRTPSEIPDDGESFGQGFDVSLLYDTSALSEIPLKAPIVSLKDANGYTLLHRAADLGCSDALKLLLAKKADPNALSPLKVTPVHVAAEKGHLHCLNLLLDYGGDCNYLDSEGKSPIDYAHRNQNILCEHLLLKHFAKVQERNSQELASVMHQLESSLQVDNPLSENNSVIHFADDKNRVHKILHREYQLRCPSELSSLVPAAMTMPSVLNCCNLFHVACHNGHLNVLQYLLMHHPEMLISITQEGFSALHVAVISNQQEIIEFLMEQITFIVQNQSPMNSEKFDDTLHTRLSKVTSVLSVEKVCDFVNAQTCLGHTALHFAAIMNHVAIIELFLSLPSLLGLDIEAKDKVQFTPLHAATFANALEAVKCLLDHNANPDTISNLTHCADVFKTPLVQACAFHYCAIFSCLLQNDAVDHDWLALQWCLSNKNYGECFYQILGSFIKQEESLSEAIKVQRRKEGLCVSNTMSVAWDGIPLQFLDMNWLEYALSACPILKSANILLNVTSFSASNCGLSVIPLEVFQLTQVVALDLSNNNISLLPSKNVESLKSSGWTCTSLERLDLSKNKITSLPSCVFELPNMTSVNVSFNCLRDISINLWTAPKLSEFLCSHNNLTSIPSKWVEYLHCHSKITSTVKDTSGFRQLQSSRFERLQGLIHSEPHARSRSLGDGSSLSPVPLEIYDDDDAFDNNVSLSPVQMSLQERRIITGCGGVTVDWNKEFTASTKTGFLVHLDFSHNQLASLPPDLPCLSPKLKYLNVSYNDLTSVCIPSGFPANLNYLYLSHNPFHFINCEKEKVISIACTNPHAKANYRNRNSICLHRSHHQLLKLQVLDLSHCNLYSVNLFMPPELQKKLSEKLKNYLKGSNTKQSESIPLVTAAVSQLNSLDNIEVLGKLTVPLLSRLILKYNNLKAIPESVCGMLNLGSLEINHNPISELCKELGHLNKLWYLPLEGLSLNFPPHSILTRGKTADITGFLQSTLQNSLPYHHVKLMFVGWSGRGKTTLLKKLTEKGQTSVISSWHGHSENFKDKNTPIIRHWTCSIPSSLRSQCKIKRITFKTWDFPSLDDSYHAIHQYFLSQRSLYLVVWNTSHGNAGVQELKSWLLNIEARAPSSPVIVVGTHSDKMTSVKQQAELGENLKLIAKLYGDLDNQIAGYPHVVASVMVSSVTGAEIKNLREKVLCAVSELGNSCVRKNFQHSFGSQLLINQLVPASYIQLEDIVCDIAESCHKCQKPPVLTYEEFREEIFKHQNLSISKDINDKELEQAVRFLHDNGTLLHYEDPLLGNLYFIDPQWLCDLLIYIMTAIHRNSLSKDGVVLLKDFSQIFCSDDFPIQWQKEYLHLLAKFELAVQLDHEHILIPSLLPKTLPQYLNPEIPKEVVCLPPIHYFFTMSSVPVGFWSQLMSILFTDTSIELLVKQCCNVHTDTIATTCWKKSQCGLELQYGNLVLLRLAEVKDYYLADPGITTVTIIDNGKFHKKANSEFHGIVLEVLDVYPIIKYSECKFGLAESKEQTKGQPSLVRTNPVKRREKRKPKPVNRDQKSVFSSSNTANKRLDQVKNQSCDIASDNSVLGALDLPVFSKPVSQSKISQTTNALLLDNRYRNSYVYKMYEETALSKAPTVQPGHRPISNEKAKKESTQRQKNKLGSEDSHDKMRAGLISKITEHIFILMEEWFPGIVSHEILIPCPYCISCKEHTKSDNPIHLKRSFATGGSLICALKGGYDEDVSNAFIFSFNECMCTSYDSKVIYCPAHGDIPLEYFVPDVFFANLGKNVIAHPNEITVQGMLGEGSYAQVFKVNLRREIQPGCVSKRTAAMKSFSKSLNETFQQKKSLEDVTLDVLVSHSKEDLAINSGIEALRRMHSEVSVVSQLNHENIIKLLGVVILPPSILLEFAPLGNLAAVCKSYYQNAQCLLPDVSRATILQIASGIEYLHARSIVFRDLKCENILVWGFPLPNSPSSNCDVHVKLSDYGISQFASISGVLGLAGTPGFIAPEILKYNGKEVYTNKVDIFSLGMVIYELTTLRCPFDDLSSQQANHSIESGVRPSLCRKDLKSSILQRELMGWCWQQDPELRPTASQVVEVVNSEEFCCLRDGICINDYGQVLCVCATHQTETDTSLSVNKEDINSFSISQYENTCSASKNAAHFEIWISSSNNIQSSTITVLDYCGKFTTIEDFKVGSSPILSICIVRNIVWMGSEDGYIHFYDAKSRYPVAQSCLDYQSPILSILHDQKTELVYILLEIGIVCAVSDDISVQLSSGRTSSVFVKLNIKAMYQIDGSTTSCFKIVHHTNSMREIWIGRNDGITVLNAETLEVVCKLKMSEAYSSCIAHITVVHVDSNTDPGYNKAAVSSVFSAFYQGQIVTQWDIRKKKIIDMLRMNDFVKDLDCTISSIHVTTTDLFVGLQSGMLLIINILASSLVVKFHCHENRVKPLFTLPVNAENLWKYQNVQNKEDKANYQLLSFGSGFRSYISLHTSYNKSLLRKPSLLLVWNIA